MKETETKLQELEVVKEYRKLVGWYECRESWCETSVRREGGGGWAWAWVWGGMEEIRWKAGRHSLDRRCQSQPTQVWAT